MPKGLETALGRGRGRWDPTKIYVGAEFLGSMASNIGKMDENGLVILWDSAVWDDF